MFLFSFSCFFFTILFFENVDWYRLKSIDFHLFSLIYVNFFKSQRFARLIAGFLRIHTCAWHFHLYCRVHDFTSRAYLSYRNPGDPVIRESGNTGIQEAGDPGILESGTRGIRESVNPGFRESGDPGIRESGNPGIRGSGDPGIPGSRDS